MRAASLSLGARLRVRPRAVPSGAPLALALCGAVRHMSVPPEFPSTKRNVLDELEQRGFVANVTSPELRKHLETPTCVYAGIDPSASSLHVGNLLPLLGLLHFRAGGHHPVALIGGATGSIGDPSGRSTERNALTPDELAVNVAGITAQVERFFERGIAYANGRGLGDDAAAREPAPAEAGGDSARAATKQVTVVNNYDWFKDISFLDFLRDVGKLARVNTMMARDSVRSRLESDQGISFTEFSYQLLQAHDFATLYRTHGCRLQLGGSDQWGNIVAGIDMIKRVRALEAREAAAAAAREAKDALDAELAGRSEANRKRITAERAKEAAAAARAADTGGPEPEPAFGLTIPLLTTSTGEKFGKSAGNAVWLDPARTSVFDFYQFFVRTPDADVEKYLQLLTLVPAAEIAAALRGGGARRAAQRLLAREVTELVHGPEAVERAETMTEVLYTSDPRGLRAKDVLAACDGDPRLVRIPWAKLKETPVSKLATQYGLVASRNEANRLIKPRNSGMAINDYPITDPRREITRGDLVDKRLAILRRGTRDMIVFYVEFPEDNTEA